MWLLWLWPSPPLMHVPASHIRSSPTGEVVPTPSVLEHALSGKPAEAAAQSLSPQPSVQSISPQPSVQSISPQPSAQPITHQPSAQPITHQPSVQPITHQPSVQPLSQPSQLPPLVQPPQTTPAGAEPSGAEEKKDSGLKKNMSRKLYAYPVALSVEPCSSPTT